MSDREATRDRDREDDVRRREGVEADPHGTGNFIKKPPGFVVGIIVAIIILMIIIRKNQIVSLQRQLMR